MQDYSLQVSHSVYLLLFLLSSIQLVAVQSFRYPHSGQKSYHEDSSTHSDEEWKSKQTVEEMEEEEEDVLQYCDGDFDVYFIIDKSIAVQDWVRVHTSWEDMVEKYLNPKLRMSFILFANQASVSTDLTSDRGNIRYGLDKVYNLRMEGSTLLQRGLEQANHQIRMVEWKAPWRTSLIIIVIWGKLSPQALAESKTEADIARSMGAYVYCVGIDSYDRKKLSEIADSEDTIFIVDSYKMFHELVDSIGTLTCLELRYVEPSPLCIGENNPVVLRGYGFHYAQNLSQIICRYKFSNSKVIDKSPIDKNFTVIICPRPDVQQSGQTILVEVSLNNGRGFLAHAIPVNTSDCKPPPVTTTVVPETSTRPPTTTPKTSPTKPTPETTIPRTTTVPTTPPPPPPPPAPPPPTSPVPPPPTTVLPPDEPSQQVVLSTMVLVLMLIPVLLWWLWWLCCRRAPKALPAPAPQPQPRKKTQPPPPESPPAPAPPVNAPPIVIVCCCTCCNVCVSRGTEGIVNVCNVNPLSHHQLPLMWSQSCDQGQCTNLDLLRALGSHVPCTSMASLPPGQEYLPLAFCSHVPDSCSQLLPLLLPPAQESP